MNNNNNHAQINDFVFTIIGEVPDDVDDEEKKPCPCPPPGLGMDVDDDDVPLTTWVGLDEPLINDDTVTS